MKRNVGSQKWRVYAFDATDGSAKTGDAANITAKLSKDGAALVATNDVNPTELEAGWYEFDLLQAESNYATVEIFPVSSTADIEVIGSPARQDTEPQYASLLGIASDGDLSKVNTLDGHTAQTGDSFARIGAAGAGLTALAQAAAYTATRAGYLDKLNVSGTLAHSNAASTYMADVSTLALEATLTAMKGAGWTDENLKTTNDLLEAIAGYLDTEIAAIKAKTDLLAFTGTDVHSTLDGEEVVSDAASRTASKADVSLLALEATVGALVTDTITEISQGVPPTNPTLLEAVMLSYMRLRNKTFVDADEIAIHNNAGTKISKKAISDDGTTFNEDKMVSGA